MKLFWMVCVYFLLSASAFGQRLLNFEFAPACKFNPKNKLHQYVQDFYDAVQKQMNARAKNFAPGWLVVVYFNCEENSHDLLHIEATHERFEPVGGFINRVTGNELPASGELAKFMCAVIAQGMRLPIPKNSTKPTKTSASVRAREGPPKGPLFFDKKILLV